MTSGARLRAATAVAALSLGLGATAADRSAAPLAEPRMPAAAVSTLPWSALTPAQKQALASLQSDWAGIEGVRQKKWLELANRFQAMPEAERIRIQQRMAQWASLTPAKRHQVRLQFLEAQQLPAEQRQARWQEYQALSADEKQALARQARQARPAINERTAAKASGDDSGPSGKQNEVKAPPPVTPKAATTTALQAKPGATTRPLTTPATPPAHHQTGLPKIVATEGFVDPSTLLPKRGPQGAAVRSALTDGPAPKP